MNTTTTITTTTVAEEEGAEEEILQVGAFHEIDHSNLSPRSPFQLKSIRIAMVSEIEKEKNLVSLRYPSIHSLRAFFTNLNLDKPDESKKKIPALDEKYVMGFDLAVKALNRRISAQEFAERRNSWAFWALSDSPQRNGIRSCENSVPNSVSKLGKCWSQLKFTGMVQWGKRRHVRFLGRHEAQLIQPNNQIGPDIGPTVGPRVVAEEEGGGNETKKRKRGEEMKRVMMTRQCNKRNSNGRGKTKVENEQRNKDAKKKKKEEEQCVKIISNNNSKNKTKQRKISIDRWSAERYKMAEENMLRVMKEKGAVYGNPILRAELRTEARKHIGDTGLLDHLLKHMAGKVAPGGSERFRRRHNAEGTMEYWLESADLVDIRQQVGVQDPYWTPPPGWKIGDSIITTNPHDHVLSITQLKEIKQDILQLKKEMMELVASKKGEEAVATPTSCLSSLNWEECGSLVSKQEIYAELMNKKAKIEEQLKEISLTLRAMAEQMGLSEEPTLTESATPPPPLLPSSGEDAPLMQENTTTAKDKEEKIERLKSGFQICKPKGTFMWPNVEVSTQVIVPNIDEDDHNVLKTPSSPPKPNTQNLPLSMPNDNPSSSSHVKPLAEKRPLSNATLKHVIGPFSPHFSTPLETP